MKTRNWMAKALANPLFKNRIVAAKKGRGSYNRQKLKKVEKNSHE